VDHTDVRPTLLALVGLKDDYVSDGRVLTEVLTRAPKATDNPGFLALAQCYKQLNSSVGLFGTDVIKADTAALASGSTANDQQYQQLETQLQRLGTVRDQLAATIKGELNNAEFNHRPLPDHGLPALVGCALVLWSAGHLAA
jgi:hypothetical protein